MNLDLEQKTSPNKETSLEDSESSNSLIDFSGSFLKKIDHTKSKVLYSLGDNSMEDFIDNEDEFSAYFSEKISLKNNNITNKILTAVVYKIKGNDVIVDVGLKNYGKLNKDELKVGINTINIKVGDKIPVVADSIDARISPYIKTSWEKAKRIELWDYLEECKKNKTVIYGAIQSETRGGYIANVMGVKAFIPGSHVDFRPPEKEVLDKMKMQEEPFIIISMEKSDQKSNIVISRREVLNLERIKIKDSAIEKIKIGDVLTGVIKNIAPYGCFVNLFIPGMENIPVDGLLHINDISWLKISHPSEVLSVGSEIQVVVIGLSPEDRKISLGIKQLTESPWKGLSEKLVVGSKVKGVVKSAAEYGYFIDLENGVEGLVHTSEISWSKKSPNLSIGQEVEVMILVVDEEKARISLSIKQCLENPLKKFSEKHKINDIVKGKIKKIMDFGFFIDLDIDIEGLVHISDFSWSQEECQKMLSRFKTDDEISVKILSMDIGKNRVYLGIKQIENDKFYDFISQKKLDDIIKCKINNNWNDKIEILIPEIGSTFIIEGELLPVDFELEKDKKYLKDSEIDTKVIEIDPDLRKLLLSCRF